MSNHTSTCLLALASILVLAPGCRCANPPQPSTSSVASRTKLQALEDKILSSADDPETDHDALLHEIQVVSKKLLWIQTGDTHHEAVDVYLCTELEKKHVCRFIYADDTIHTTEFPERYAPIVVQADQPLQVGCEGPCPANLQFFLGDPYEMHSSGYNGLTALPLSEAGVLTLLDAPVNTQQVIFTIVKQPGDGLYRKYVWVIEKR